MKIILLSALLVGFACLAACKKKRDCNLPAFRYRFTGFDSTEKLVIIIRRYQSGSNRTKLLEERIASSSVATSTIWEDTLAESLLYFGHTGDEVITLPYAGGRTFVLRDLSLGGETQTFDLMEEVKLDCTQSWSMYLNDSVLDNHNTPPSGTHYLNGYIYNIALKK